MKLTKKIIFLAFLLIISGCSNVSKQEVSKKDFDTIVMGTSTKCLQAKLSEPFNVIKNEKEMKKIAEKDLQTLLELTQNDSDKLVSFVGGEDVLELQEQMTKLTTESKDLQIYQYKISDGKTENLYMINDTVILRSFN